MLGWSLELGIFLKPEPDPRVSLTCNWGWESLLHFLRKVRERREHDKGWERNTENKTWSQGLCLVLVIEGIWKKQESINIVKENYVLQVIILAGFSNSKFRWFSLTGVLRLCVWDNVCLSYQLKALKVIWELQGTFCIKSSFFLLALFYVFCWERERVYDLTIFSG